MGPCLPLPTPPHPLPLFEKTFLKKASFFEDSGLWPIPILLCIPPALPRSCPLTFRVFSVGLVMVGLKIIPFSTSQFPAQKTEKKIHRQIEREVVIIVVLDLQTNGNDY